MDKTYDDPCYGMGGPQCIESPCPDCGREARVYPPVENPIPKGLGFDEALVFCAEQFNRDMMKALLDTPPTTYTVKTCTTHHHACDCREARFRDLLEDTLQAHATPDNGNYNYCDEDPCAWCLEAKDLLGINETPTQ